MKKSNNNKYGGGGNIYIYSTQICDSRKKKRLHDNQK